MRYSVASRVPATDANCSYYYLVSNYFHPEKLPQRGVWFVSSIRDPLRQSNACAGLSRYVLEYSLMHPLRSDFVHIKFLPMVAVSLSAESAGGDHSSKTT